MVRCDLFSGNAQQSSLDESIALEQHVLHINAVINEINHTSLMTLEEPGPSEDHRLPSCGE